jgi:UDP-glucuronate 4-epimerase
MSNDDPKTILVTGAAGFIGFHMCARLLKEGHTVIGIDSLSPYYDVRIKEKRLDILKGHPSFSFEKVSIAEYAALGSILQRKKIGEIIHLAAQAGVRYSLSNPTAYGDANYIGTLNVFEAARQFSLPRVIYASSSSVYGDNEKQPFSESDPVDRPSSLYAATKRANELLAYSYNRMFGTDMVGLRFFTVYGQWGRPDMAIFKFTKRMMQNKPIDVYNNGNMKRSFTYVDDVVDATMSLLQQTPQGQSRIYNLGGDEAVPLMKFIERIEKEIGVTSEKNMLPLQQGDVVETVADCALAARDLGYKPKVGIEEGIQRFVNWFKENRDFLLSLEDPAQ